MYLYMQRQGGRHMTYRSSKKEKDKTYHYHIEEKPIMAKKMNLDDDDVDVEMAIKISKSTPASPTSASKLIHGRQQQRLVSLDVFRGLTVVLMILVDNVGGLVPAINHSPWNGLTLADLVMPFFLFMVGVSLSLAFKRLSSKPDATKKAILRTLKLLALGLFLQGGYFHGIKDLTFGVDIKQMRWMGILQRIAIAYLVAALCEIWLKRRDNNNDNVNTKFTLFQKYQFQWVVGLIISVVYISLLYGLHVPDWEYRIDDTKTFTVKCGVRGDTGPACNVAGMIDRKILGIQHLYKRPIYARTKQCSLKSPDYGPSPVDAPTWCQAPFDPEGLLSSLMALVSCLLGLHYGHIILHFKDHRDIILHWSIVSFTLVVLGIGLDLFGMRINKPLYTLSYMCVTAATAGFLFAALYLIVDVSGYRRLMVVMEWMGKHALLIFVLVASNLLPVFLHGFYWGKPQNNILSLIGIGK